MGTDRQQSRILVLEDEPLIALDLEVLLEDAGFRIAGVTGKLEKALALIEAGECDGAVLDACLGTESSLPAATALSLRDLPFLVLSGHDVEEIRYSFPNAHFLQKPVQGELLIGRLTSLLDDSPRS